MEMVQDRERISRPNFSAREWVRDQIHQQIIRGVIPHGARLHQERLAKEFDVGRGVLREALMELQRFGLVRTIHNKGIFVTRPSIKNLLAIYQVREMLDGLAARLCSERITASEVAELRVMAQQSCDLGLAGRIADAGARDREFHDRIVHLSGNETLIRVIDTYRFVLKKFVWKSQAAGDVARHFTRVFEEHTAIIDALAAGNGEEAERVSRRHIQTIIAGLKHGDEQVIPSEGLDLSALERE